MDFVFLTKADGLIMGPISTVLGWILNGVYEFLSLFTGKYNGTIGVANIALCIILFTIVVKMLMLPLTIKQQKSSKLSAQMSPELSAITAKYKGKTDEASRRKMQMETQAVYEKYGTNPMVGCLTLLISLPILFALYRVIYAIPAYVGDVKDMYMLAADAIKPVDGYVETLIEFVKEAGVAFDVEKVAVYNSQGALTLKDVHIVDLLAKCNAQQWSLLAGETYFNMPVLVDYSKQILGIHQFVFGMNVLDTPSWTSISVLIPVLSTAFQFLQTKLSMSSTQQKDNPAASSMKTMNIFLPIMSGFICFMMPIGAGLYWIITSVVQIVQQFFINKYMNKISVEELIAKNQAKRAKKAGITSGNQMSQVARTSTKSIEVEEIKTTKDFAHLPVVSADEADEQTDEQNNDNTTNNTPVSGGSISKYANILKDRNGK